MTIITLYTPYILKTTFQTEEPKILIYRDFKNFTFADFQSELINELNSRNSLKYCAFEKSFVEVFYKHAPKKRKILRGNENPHVNKTLHSGIMKYSQLKKSKR